MPGFYFRPVDLSSLALLFVAFLVGWRLATLRYRSPAGRWLLAFFASSGLFALCSIVANARLDSWQFYAIHLQVVFAALSVAALLQYVYRVGDLDPQGRRARLAGLASLAPLVFIFAWAIYQFWQLSSSGNPSTNTSLSEGLTCLGLGWVLVVTLRQARQEAAHPRQQSEPPNLALLILGVALLLLAGGFQFIGGILPGFVPKSIYTVYAVSIAIIVIGFNYFLNWDRANTRINRIIAAALVLLQSIFAVLAFVFNAQFAATPLPQHALADGSLVLLPDGQAGYQIQQSDVQHTPSTGQALVGGQGVIHPDFPLVFFGKQYSTLLVRPGRLLFGERWSAQKANYYLQPDIFVANLPGELEHALITEVAAGPQQVTVRWTLPEGGMAQASIDRTGRLELSYNGLGGYPLRSWGLSAGQGLAGVDFIMEYPPAGEAIPAAGILFESSFAERQRQDSWTRPILFFQVVMSGLLVATLYAVSGRLESQTQALLGQTLTRQQLEIASLVAAGQSNAEIAQTLSITEATVKYHLTRIFQALNIKSRRALAAWYRQMAKK